MSFVESLAYYYAGYYLTAFSLISIFYVLGKMYDRATKRSRIEAEKQSKIRRMEMLESFYNPKSSTKPYVFK